MLKCMKLLILCLLCGWGENCFGLQPIEVMVVVNAKMAGSVDLVRYYMEKRGVPSSHLLP